MNIAKKLGLTEERFCRMIIITKMLFSNVLGHAAELQYEKNLTSRKIPFKKAPTDVHYDYLVKGERHQVKRFESSSTNEKNVGVNLTQTHGNRNGPDAFYKNSDFEKLILADVGLINFLNIDIKDVPVNKKYKDRLVGRYSIERPQDNELDDFELEFLNVMKVKNAAFPKAIKSFKRKHKCTYKELLEKVCNLSFNEIDSLFSAENFRLIVGAKGFAAEEHLNTLLDKHKIPYHQIEEMYSKVDHLVKNKTRVQVKIPNERSTNSKYWGIKTHKSHGHGIGELFKDDEFDLLALFIGFEIDEEYSKYFPKSVSIKFIFIPMSKLERHPKFPGYLKRVSKIQKGLYNINDISIF